MKTSNKLPLWGFSSLLILFFAVSPPCFSQEPPQEAIKEIVLMLVEGPREPVLDRLLKPSNLSDEEFEEKKRIALGKFQELDEVDELVQIRANGGIKEIKAVPLHDNLYTDDEENIAEVIVTIICRNGEEVHVGEVKMEKVGGVWMASLE